MICVKKKNLKELKIPGSRVYIFDVKKTGEDGAISYIYHGLKKKLSKALDKTGSVFFLKNFGVVRDQIEI